MKIAVEGEVMTGGANLFHGSTVRTEKQLFDEPYQKNNDTISGRDHEGDTVKNNIPWKVISAVENSTGENEIRPPFSFFKGT